MKNISIVSLLATCIFGFSASANAVMTCRASCLTLKKQLIGEYSGQYSILNSVNIVSNSAELLRKERVSRGGTHLAKSFNYQMVVTTPAPSTPVSPEEFESGSGTLSRVNYFITTLQQATEKNSCLEVPVGETPLLSKE